jgi:hypothetical protein
LDLDYLQKIIENIEGELSEKPIKESIRGNSKAMKRYLTRLEDSEYSLDLFEEGLNGLVRSSCLLNLALYKQQGEMSAININNYATQLENFSRELKAGLIDFYLREKDSRIINNPI